MSERVTMTLSSRPKEMLWGLCTRRCCTFSCCHVTVPGQQQGNAWVTGMVLLRRNTSGYGEHTCLGLPLSSSMLPAVRSEWNISRLVRSASTGVT